MKQVYILADKQDITRIGLKTLISEENTFLTADNSKNLRSALRNNPESIVILDFTLFDFESFTQMLNVRSSAPKSRWLLFSDELSEEFIRNILLNDSSFSIIMKGDSINNITAALNAVASQSVYHCQYAIQILNKELLLNTQKETLTSSEKSVLRQIAIGKSTKEIASDMNLSFHTINTHRKNIFRKIEVNNVHEAIKYALRSGIADMSDYII